MAFLLKGRALLVEQAATRPQSPQSPSLIAKIASPQAAMEKFKPQVRGFTREVGTFTPMGAEYVQFGWLEVKLNTALKWNRMFCTIEQSEEQRILRCYSNDDMKEVLSSSFLVSGQYTEESPLLGELAWF